MPGSLHKEVLAYKISFQNVFEGLILRQPRAARDIPMVV
jgi:hypothetical protein